MPAAARAPKSRDMMNEHYWFCQPHAAEYNRNWNFFAGMSEGEIKARQEQDPFNMFGHGGVHGPGPQAAPARRLGKIERNALADLDLDDNAEGPAIRARYTELVKRCHPDANGGDRSAEHKLQRVIKAYQALRKAGMV